MKKKRKYHNCKICKEQGILHTTYNLEQHLKEQHNICLARYFEKYYCIPANINYDIDLNTLCIIVKDLYSHNKQQINCIEHFQTILQQVDNNAARLNIRLNNQAYTILRYLGINFTGNSSRRTKAELEALNIQHKVGKKRKQSIGAHHCKICNKLVNDTRLLWHVSMNHHISPKEYLIAYYELPDNTNFDLLTFPLVVDMYKELQNNTQYDSYIELYSSILNSYKNYQQMIINYNYDIAKVCIALGVLKKQDGHLYSVTDLRNIKGNIKIGFRKDLGQLFRSGWEANVARILRLESIEYQYEPQIFDVNLNGVHKKYIPDFYVGNNVFFEVKGRWTNAAKQKVKAFKEQYPQYMLCVIDKYIYAQLQQQYRSQIKNWED